MHVSWAFLHLQYIIRFMAGVLTFILTMMLTWINLLPVIWMSLWSWNMEIWSKLFFRLCTNSKLNTQYTYNLSKLRVGHKTNFIPFTQLSHPKQLNKLMDTYTKARVDHIFSEQIPAPPNNIKFEGWCCWINNTKSRSDPKNNATDPLWHHEALPCTSRPLPYVNYWFQFCQLGCTWNGNGWLSRDVSTLGG